MGAVIETGRLASCPPGGTVAPPDCERSDAGIHPARKFLRPPPDGHVHPCFIEQRGSSRKPPATQQEGPQLLLSFTSTDFVTRLLVETRAWRNSGADEETSPQTRGRWLPDRLAVAADRAEGARRRREARPESTRGRQSGIRWSRVSITQRSSNNPTIGTKPIVNSVRRMISGSPFADCAIAPTAKTPNAVITRPML